MLTNIQTRTNVSTPIVITPITIRGTWDDGEELQPHTLKHLDLIARAIVRMSSEYSTLVEFSLHSGDDCLACFTKDESGIWIRS